MGRARTFLSLRLGDQFRLVTAACLLLGIWVGIFIFPFDHFRKLLVKIGSIAGKLVPGKPDPERIAQIVNLADMHLPGDRTCLVRSLSTEVLLNIYNYTFTHRIGVDRTSEDGFRAHSWIEYDGEILIGQLDDIDAFEPLPPLGNNNIP